MSTLTHIPASDDQIDHLADLVRKAAKKAIKDLGPSKDGAQLVHSRGGEFIAPVVEAIIASFNDLSVTGKYRGEEVRSTLIYPPEYKTPKPIEEQIEAIARIFGLDPKPAPVLAFAKTLPALPEGAEGWFAVPAVEAIAKKHFPKVEKTEEKYCQAVQFALDLLEKSRPFTNYRCGQVKS